MMKRGTGRSTTIAVLAAIALTGGAAPLWADCAVTPAECNDGNPCTIDTCLPVCTNGSCPSACRHDPGNAGTVCRAKRDACDVADTCSGSSATCPADQHDACIAPTYTPPAGAPTPTPHVAACGNGVIDAGEQCDRGGANGDPTACCTAQCTLRTSGATCRTTDAACWADNTCNGVSGFCPLTKTDAGTPCADDGATCTEDVCNGAGVCTHPAGHRGTVCRAAADTCDGPETCNGASPSCPADGTALPLGAVCESFDFVGADFRSAQISLVNDAHWIPPALCLTPSVNERGPKQGAAWFKTNHVDPSGDWSTSFEFNHQVYDFDNVTDGFALIFQREGVNADYRSNLDTPPPAIPYLSIGIDQYFSEGDRYDEELEVHVNEGQRSPVDLGGPVLGCSFGVSNCDLRLTANYTASAHELVVAVRRVDGSRSASDTWSLNLEQLLGTTGDFTVGFAAYSPPYTGVGTRSERREVTSWSFTMAVKCGNGTLESGEICDEGANNGQPGSCCSAECLPIPDGGVCRAQADTCDVAERCDGASPACPADRHHACVAPTYTPQSGAPTPTPHTVVCGDGIVDAGEQCDRGSANGDPTTCCSAQCTLRASGTTCRTSDAACYTTNVCNGVSGWCPIDPKPAGTSCADDGLACTDDRCDGGGACLHPLEPAGTVCRSATGICDGAETCTGSSPSCPADGSALPPGASCGGFDFTTSDWQSTQLSLVNNAAWVNDANALFTPNNERLRLTTTASGQQGSAWLNVDHVDPSRDWSTSFTFQHSFASAGGADGLALIFQRDGAGANYPTGLDGAPPTSSPYLAIGIDTYFNAGLDAYNESLEVHVNRTFPGPIGSATQGLNLSSANFPGCAANLQDCIYQLSATYSAANSRLVVTVTRPGGSGSVSGTWNLNLATLLGTTGDFTVGFAGSTGGSAENHDVLTWSFSIPVKCGNGTVEAGESCDEGAANGSGGSCCSASCTLLAAGAVCRPLASLCDMAETCSGSSPSCPADLEPACTATPTATWTPTVTRTATVTRTPTATPTATRSSTATASATRTFTASATLTPSHTATPSATPTSTATSTPTQTASTTATATVTPTASATVTGSPPSTATSTDTPVDTATPTPVDTTTPTATPADTTTCTATPDDTTTATPTATPVDTATPDDTATATPTDTETPSATPTPTDTETPTPSVALSPTATASNPVATDTPTPTPSASPTPLFVEDADGDGVLDADDNCPALVNPAQTDADGDQHGDVCDPCTRLGDDGLLGIRPKLRVGKTNTETESGNDSLLLSGEMLSAVAFSALDPLHDGARVTLHTGTGVTVTDVLLPAGAYGGRGTRGWRSHGTPVKAWSYQDKTAKPPRGLVKLMISDRSNEQPRQIKISLRGNDDSYPVAPSDTPLRAIVVLGDDTARLSGACGETAFTAAQCRFNRSGEKITCKP